MPTEGQVSGGHESELEAFADQIVPLASSTINTVYYSKEDQTLDIVFTSGRSYTLNDVPPDVFLGLVHAPSPGRYFNTNLKGKYL